MEFIRSNPSIAVRSRTFETLDRKRGGMECDACGAGGARLVCPCHAVRYCSKERQTKVFKDHKKKCTNWLLKEVEIREEKKLRRVMQHDEDANEWDEYQM